MHMGALCIENAPTLIVIKFLSVATGVTLVAIGSRRAAIGWSSCNSFVSSFNGSDLLYLVPSSCNLYSFMVAIDLVSLLQLVYTR
jgi:hypothetical protein